MSLLKHISIQKAGLIILLFVLMIPCKSYSQVIKESAGEVIISSDSYTIRLDLEKGTADFTFPNGSYLKNTVATLQLKNGVSYSSAGFGHHSYKISEISDITVGKSISFIHTNNNEDLQLVQYITVYNDQGHIMLGVAAKTQNDIIESNYIAPLAILPQHSGKAYVPSEAPRLLDMPFDNDNWTKLLTVNWNDSIRSGTGYEFTALYDYETLSGLVIGNLTHDFWKTGIRYTLSAAKGFLDSLIIYGGAATPNNKWLPNEYGGYDGTHDVVAHGSMRGTSIFAPLIFLGASGNIATAFKEYGRMNAKISGSLNWKGYAPVYWNSFGVEDVLGYRKIMMPSGVAKISDFLSDLKNFSRYSPPVLSIDSYDQEIYTTDILKSIDQYAGKHFQQMGFYFIPFAIWTWKSGIDRDKLQHTDAYIRDVTLKDNNGKTIIYKEGDFGAYPLDPTHPATRQRIITELQKARAIGARFLKIDFLTAGALETPRHYDPNVRSGLQAYNKGMKMLQHLIDSILGPDIFITHAISPAFPHQFAHARFLSTDIYSHFRDDIDGFPHHGSTASSMISNAHLGWMQGTLLPYSNLDVLVMSHFQNNPAISEKEVRVRLFSLITLGSILGDGSDFRKLVAKERAKLFLDNKNVADYFAAPKAFEPLKLPDGLKQDQQISFYLSGDTVLISAFNFHPEQDFIQEIDSKRLGLKQNMKYMVQDFLTNRVVDNLEANQPRVKITAPKADAILIRLVPVK